MCGRSTYNLTWEEIVWLYRLTLNAPPHNLRPRFNVCPTTNIDVVVREDEKRELLPMRWGLVPSWWSKPLKELKLATFNARAETVASNPFFRGAFQLTRCLMPVSGYYEWEDTPGGKQPYYFTRRDGQPLTIAGLWDEWREKTAGENLKSYAMVITGPNKFVAEVHDRMPVILEHKDFEQWESGETKDAVAIMKPADEDVLQRWPVSKRVNSSRANDDDPTLIEIEKSVATADEILAAAAGCGIRSLVPRAHLN
ncbi:MAG TPA: SOS response-associated peptidase [Pirellulaceae bacterium]|jgi:putative SOS response-associated peptidase YedK